MLTITTHSYIIGLALSDGVHIYHIVRLIFTPSGCGSAWLERLIWDQEVAGSNPVTPTYKTLICIIHAGVVQW